MMNSRAVSYKLLLMLLLLGGAVFFGGGVVRAAIGYDLFVPGAPTLIRKPFLTDAQVNYSIRLYGITAFYTLSGYAAALIGALGLTVVHRRSLRQNGGMFMAAMLFYLCAPVEVYAAVCDIHILRAASELPFDELLRDGRLPALFAERTSPFLSQAGTITTMAYLTAIVFAAWRPLTKQGGAEEVRY